ncbi:hypothetical protein ONA91_40670 [Micromonospora sp. DR5-3]|uniref:hypothetical protein n=1 Tax=unclassified Micromonospora TaxID=2617518 RepID=UPI001652402C|nr:MULTISPECIES: hypothetical protein [unclassified Micromonospora]MCW3820758.1 hypothetical protein [Micromonospora sp. DR5-3]
MMELRHLTSELPTLADGVVAAGLPLGGKPGTALDEAYGNLRVAAKARLHLDAARPLD